MILLSISPAVSVRTTTAGSATATFGPTVKAQEMIPSPYKALLFACSI
jgi:hypothetical protein